MEDNSRLYQLCQEIEDKYNEDAVNTAFTLLLKLLTNLANNPNEPKFRIFKKTNDTIKSKILIIKETETLIREIGYVDEGSDLTFKDPRVDKIKKAIEIISITKKKVEEKLKEKQLKQQQLTQNKEYQKLNEEINARLREEARKKQELMKQLENDKKERAKREKAQDSNACDLKYGATLKKFEAPKNQRG